MICVSDSSTISETSADEWLSWEVSERFCLRLERQIETARNKLESKLTELFCKLSSYQSRCNYWTSTNSILHSFSPFKNTHSSCLRHVTDRKEDSSHMGHYANRRVCPWVFFNDSVLLAHNSQELSYRPMKANSKSPSHWKAREFLADNCNESWILQVNVPWVYPKPDTQNL